jgi:nitroreductase
MNHTSIKKSIIRSQHCQRNWDLSREIPEDDLNLLVTAGTQCPSKQNIAFYRLHFITNRHVIQEIHNNTKGFVVKLDPTPEYTTNTQTLANLLVVFEEYKNLNNINDWSRNDQTRAMTSNSDTFFQAKKTFEIDQNLAVGVAAGYLNLTASMLGYATGCCSCFDQDKIKEYLNLDNDVLLLMGIGFKNLDLNRRVSHVDNSYSFPTKSKQPIEINFIK